MDRNSDQCSNFSQQEAPRDVACEPTEATSKNRNGRNGNVAPSDLNQDAFQLARADDPKHIAVIMDGNGRWAKSRSLPRLEGHREGAKAVQRLVEACRRRGIRYLTLFSFSTENWNREKTEVSGLMQLFKQYLDSEIGKLLKNDIRLRAVGDLSALPDYVRETLDKNIEKTRSNSSMDLILAVSYGGREEIVAATKSIAVKIANGELTPEDVDHQCLRNEMWSCDIPDPELLIRTSGEMRVSNFLLWQIAYAEIVVTSQYWPDFTETTLTKCIDEYHRRERRFGRTSEQVASLQRDA